MKTENKIFIKVALIAGLIYAGIMAGFDYATGENFSLLKSLFHFTFFGLIMGLLARYNNKKQMGKNNR